MSEVRPPSGKTILVARNVGDGSRGGTGGSVVAPSELNLPRDARTGKLNSYAALGGSDDVELFEKYLNSQSQRAAVVNPASVRGALNAKASAKRRSLSHANLNLAEGVGSSNNNNNNNNNHSNNSSANNSNRHITEQEKLEVELDAKQKRELAVRYRKWLKTLTIQERVAHQRQQNVLRKWQQVNKQWEEFKSRTSKRLGKHPTDLVMSRASTYRSQVEEHEAIERAIPLTDKVGDDIWLVSLRNEGTRYVAVGNIFSGLFCPIRENGRRMLPQLIRRPLEAELLAGGTAISRRNTSAALENKKRKIKKQLQEVYPHQIDIADSGALKVDTMDLFEWAMTAGSRACDSRDTGDSIESKEDSSGHELQSVEEEILTSRTNTSHTPSSPRVQGPHCRVFIPDARPDANAPNLGTVSLSFFTPVHTLQQRDVVIENNGSVALQYRWTSEHRSEVATAQQQKTSVAHLCGVLLPGERRDFKFSFVSKVCGTFQETWSLLLDPPVKDLAGEELISGVQIHGTSVDRSDIAMGNRKKCLQTRVSDTTNSFMAQQVLNDIVNGLLERYQLEEEVAEEIDYRHQEPTFRDVYYSRTLQQSGAHLYERSLNVLRASVTAENPAEDTSKSVESPTTAAGFAVQWDGNLSTLEAITRAADQVNQKAELSTGSKAAAKEEENEDDEEGDMDEETSSAREKEKLENSIIPPPVWSLEQEFRMLRCANVFAPYDNSYLSKQMGQSISEYCSEVPIVKDAVIELDQESASFETRIKQLLCQAIDKAMAKEHTEQVRVQLARRSMQRLCMPKKLTTECLNCLRGERVNIVVFVDLDLSEWFILNGDKWMMDPAISRDEHKWVPRKVQVVVKLIELIQQRTRAAPQIILVSDLTEPPKPKGTKETLTSHGNTRKSLSLRQVAILLERAFRVSERPIGSVEFAASLEELKDKMRPKTSSDAGSRAVSDAEKPRIILAEHIIRLLKPSADSDRPSSSSRPHTPGISNSSAASTTTLPKKAVSSAVEPPAKAKPGAAHAAAAKKGAATNDKPQPKTAATPSPVPNPVPIPEAPAPSPEAPPSGRPPTSSARRPAETISVTAEEYKRFGSLLSPCCDVLVVDTFLPQWCEDLLRHVEPIGRPSLARGPRLVGPTMEASLAAWQRVVSRRSAAVVGGKSLEQKFRLLDGLVEVVDTIFFVGELAVSMCRVLAVTKKNAGALSFEDALLLAGLKKLRQKAQRCHVQMFLPIDWIVGETALHRSDESATSRVISDATEDENEDEDDDKETKKPVLTDREELAGRCNQVPYEAERVHVKIASADEDTKWFNMEHIDSEQLGQIEVVDWSKRNVLQTAMDSAPEASLNGVNHRMAWTHHAFDIGPLSMSSLVRSLEEQSFEVVVCCGVPGAVEFVEFGEATRALVTGLHRLLEAHKVSQVLVAGKRTAEWICHLQKNELKLTMPLNEMESVRATCKNAPVFKEWLASLPHPALTSLAERSEEPS